MAKAALVMLLSKYRFESVDGNPIQFATHSVGLVPKGGLKVNVFIR